ncbi:phosphatase PAP2 family protein [uncultured Ruminococcus sp.]|uniref:phosphatase PAP2 family protein n=1 Tax=uncultured Ruminococcus sp. TaxID=165186 RepID=UPI0025F5DF8B|nr:phosphatase PAP2 family protein [uncultured Ruminococcus sp.]
MIVISTETYKSIVGFFKRNKPCNTVLKLCYNFLPFIMFVSYGILIVFMFFSDIKIFARITLSPLTVFAIVTFFRKIFNRPRPYEKFATTSVFGKNKKGESMPSRHTACAFIIAMAFMYVSIPLGIAYLIISAFIMISRVLAGVHFISDVIVGMAISLLYGYFSFFII